MRILLILVAAAGLALSVLAHLSTFFGVNPRREVPAIWLLHLGLFVVYLGALIAAGKMAMGIPVQERGRFILRFAPLWLRSPTGALFAYAFLNFFFVLYLNEGGVPAKINADLVLHDHGRVIRKLTPVEYEQHEAYVVRGFSGTWMLFYSGSLLILAACGKAN